MAETTLTDALVETLAVFRSTGEPGEPLTTQEVSDELAVSRRSTYSRLERLAEGGVLATKKVGARGRVWWQPPGEVAADTKELATDGDVETMLGRLIDNLPGMVYRCRNEPGWPMSYVSTGCAAVSGYDSDAVESGDVSWGQDVIHPQDRERVRGEVEDGLAHGGHFALQYRIQTRDGETRWVWERGCAVAGDGPDAELLEGVIMDITDQREDQRALSESDEQFRALVEATEEYAIFMLDREGRVNTWNPGAERIKGYEKGEIVGEHFSQFYTEADREADVPEENLAAASEDGMTEDEGWRVRKDGSRFWANVTISAVRDDDGELRGFAKVTRDMTERHEYEQRIEHERDLVDQLFETSPVGIAVFAPDLTVERVNDRLERDLDLPITEGEVYSPGDHPLYDADGDPVPAKELPVVRVLETGEPVYGRELEVRPASGAPTWIAVNAAPITDEDGEITRVVSTISDVSRLKEQARQLQRQRDEVVSELEAVFTRVDDAFLGTDEDWHVTHVNDQAAALVGLGPEEMIGERVGAALPLFADGRPRALAEEAMASQERVEFEEFSETLGIWVEVRIYPSESGLSVYFRDVTDRKNRQSELELYETIVSAIEDGVYLLDENFEFVQVNDAYAEMTGYDRDELVGSHCSLVIDDETTAESARKMRQIAAGEREGATLEADIVRKDGSRLPAESSFTTLQGDTDGARKVGVVRDVSERVERERELEQSKRRYQTLIENFPNGAVALVDHDLRYVTAGGTPIADGPETAADLEGDTVRSVLSDEMADVFEPRYEAALAGEASAFEYENDEHYARVQIVPVRDEDGEVFAAMGMSQDVTEQKERERELREAKAQLEAATEAGAVGTWEWHVQEDRFVAGASFARIVGLDPAAAREGIPIERLLDAIHEDDRQRVDKSIDEALASCGEFEEEYRVWNADGHLRWVVARGHVECDDDGTAVTFPGALTDITARKQAGIELERHRQQLAALNRLNAVVRDITEAVIEQSTREEIEQVVCEALTESDSYVLAWTGEVDVNSETVTVRTAVGRDGYLDDVTITVDPDDRRSDGPTGRALRTGEVQTVHDIQGGDRHDPWRDQVEEYGFGSSAAIPLVHEGTVYGVVNVYAERPYAFEGEEREVVGQLGEIVGHAIAAVERKRALMSDELVELKFRIASVFESLGIDPDGGRIELVDTVPIKDDEYLVYGTVNDDGVESLEALVEASPHWTELSVHGEDSDRTFELQLSEPPVLSTLASLGGSIDEAVIEDGDYRMTLHVSPSAEVRQLIDVVTETYPDAEMLSRRQIERTDNTGEEISRVLAEELTDRQRTALRAAYNTDFFAWPRETTGEEVADSLDVSPPTFHQHLRKAEQKVFDSLLSDANATAGRSD